METIFGCHFQPLLTLLMTPIGIARHNYHMNTNLIMRPSGHILGSLEDGSAVSTPIEDDTNL